MEFPAERLLEKGQGAAPGHAALLAALFDYLEALHRELRALGPAEGRLVAVLTVPHNSIVTAAAALYEEDKAVGELEAKKCQRIVVTNRSGETIFVFSSELGDRGYEIRNDESFTFYETDPSKLRFQADGSSPVDLQLVLEGTFAEAVL